MKKIIPLALVSCSLILVGGTCLGRSEENVNKNINVEVNVAPEFLTYSNDTYGFGFEYPSDYQIISTSNEEIYLTKAGEKEIKFYIQPYETAPEEDFLLYSKNTLLKLQGAIQNNEEARTINDIPVLVTNFAYDVPGGGFVRTAEFFIGNDYIKMSMQIHPEEVEQPKNPVNDEMREWSKNVVDRLEKGELLSAEELARIEVFDQVLSSIEDSWEIYTDSTYDFKFRYPRNWEYTDPVSGDEQGRGYLDPIGFNEEYHLLSIRMDLVPYHRVLDIEPTEWRVIKRETQTINGIEITHEVGEAPRNLGTEELETYTYNSYIIPFDESKTLTFFLADNDGSYVDTVNDILDSLNFGSMSTDPNDSNLTSLGWNRIKFGELDFSIMLPFDENQLFENYSECGPEEGCDHDGYSYSGRIEDGSGDFVQVTSVSEQWSPSTEGSIYNVHDIDESGGEIKVIYGNSDNGLLIHPIETVTIGDKNLYVFDPIVDYYKNGDYIDITGVEPAYAVVFSLDTTKYKAGIIYVQVDGMELKDLTQALNSIQFTE